MKSTIGILAVLLLASCADSAPPSGASAAERLVRSTEYGGEWPFTVDAGTIKCEPAFGSAVVIVANNIKYALNGRARGQLQQTGWHDSREIIQKDDAGNYRNVNEFIAIGTKFCEGQ